MNSVWGGVLSLDVFDADGTPRVVENLSPNASFTLSFEVPPGVDCAHF